MPHCPSPAALEQFIALRGASPEKKRVAAHLKTCAACAQLVGRAKTRPLARAVAKKKVAPPEPEDPLLGTRLGEYVVEALLGEGGMGVVYRGRQPIIGKPVAIKVLREDIATREPSLPARLLSEARAAVSVGHRGIVDIFSFGQTPDGRSYFVSELLQGQPLDAVLDERGKLPQREAIELLLDLLGAVAAAHAAGVVHRDLKPSNLFLVQEPDGARFIKILDFGLAKSAGSRVKTTRGVVLGSPGYLSPEQLQGEPATAASDLYAVGILAFELVAGRRPFKGGATQVVYSHCETPPPPPSTWAGPLHPRFEAWILSLLAKTPQGRPPSAAAARLELESIAAQVATKRRSEDRSEVTEPAGRPLPAPAGWKQAVKPVANLAARLMGQLGPAASPRAARQALAAYREVAPKAPDLEALAAATLEAVQGALAPAVAALFLRDKSGRQTALGTSPPSAAKEPSREAIAAAVEARRDLVFQEGDRCILVSPLLEGTRVQGVLYCHTAPGAPGFNADDEERLSAISSVAARALHRLGWGRRARG